MWSNNVPFCFLRIFSTRARIWTYSSHSFPGEGAALLHSEWEKENINYWNDLFINHLRLDQQNPAGECGEIAQCSILSRVPRVTKCWLIHFLFRLFLWKVAASIGLVKVLAQQHRPQIVFDINKCMSFLKMTCHFGEMFDVLFKNLDW